MNVDKTQAAPIAVGAVAGAGIGAAAGVAVANRRPAAAEYRKAAVALNEAKDSFISSAKETAKGVAEITKLVDEDKAVKELGTKLADAKKAQKDLPADATDKVKKAAQAAVDKASDKLAAGRRKAAVTLLGKEENKGLKEGIEKAAKNFAENSGKTLADAADKAKKALTTSRVKWAAGIAAAGIAIGALAGAVVNKVKAGKKAE